MNIYSDLKAALKAKLVIEVAEGGEVIKVHDEALNQLRDISEALQNGRHIDLTLPFDEETAKGVEEMTPFLFGDNITGKVVDGVLIPQSLADHREKLEMIKADANVFPVAAAILAWTLYDIFKETGYFVRTKRVAN